MRIFVTGDCHSKFTRFSTENFPEQKELTKEDAVIILGDFGGFFKKEENREEEKRLDFMENRPFTTLVVDGNHENFDRLEKYPETEFHGGKVHKIRESILHLKRGEIFTLNNMKFFVFGGAKSADTILDPRKFAENSENPAEAVRIMEYKLRSKGYRVRTKGYTWWPQELPTKKEMVNGVGKLKENGWKTDYILTHEAPSPVVAMLGYNPYEFSDFLNEIRKRTIYSKWLCGHYHVEQKILDIELVYRNIVELTKD